MSRLIKHSLPAAPDTISRAEIIGDIPWPQVTFDTSLDPGRLEPEHMLNDCKRIHFDTEHYAAYLRKRKRTDRRIAAQEVHFTLSKSPDDGRGFIDTQDPPRIVINVDQNIDLSYSPHELNITLYHESEHIIMLDTRARDPKATSSHWTDCYIPLQGYAESLTGRASTWQSLPRFAAGCLVRVLSVSARTLYTISPFERAARAAEARYYFGETPFIWLQLKDQGDEAIL